MIIEEYFVARNFSCCGCRNRAYLCFADIQANAVAA